MGDVIQSIYFFTTSRTLPSLQPTRYGALSTSICLTYDATAARAAFGFGDPAISTSRADAATATRAWLERGGRRKFYGDSGAVSEQAAALYFIHRCHGYLYMLIGMVLFFRPEAATSAFGVPTTAGDALGATITQTAGLITTVLGAYSWAAAEGQWSFVYFRMTYFPRLLTVLAFSMLLVAGKLPSAFLGFVVCEAGLVVATFRCLAQAKRDGVNPGHLRLHFDRLFVAQALHAVASGVFQICMLLQPRATLAFMMGVDSADIDAAAVTWGHVMGALEIFMTWTYFASAVVGGLEPFARLSVVTRLGAASLLGVGFVWGVSTLQQLLGVIADAILGLITLAVLLTTNRLERRVDTAPGPRGMPWACSL
jgi:hypothetical protein